MIFHSSVSRTQSAFSDLLPSNKLLGYFQSSALRTRARSLPLQVLTSPRPSIRHQFRGRVSPLLLFESFNEYTRTRRGKLFGVSAIDEFLQTFAPREHGPDSDLLS